jgi:3-oxoacyl-(acyl-carrier-protein) synthase
MSRVVITGNGVICGAGAIPCSILDDLLAGHSALAPITSFNAEPFRGGSLLKCLTTTAKNC